MPFWRPDNQGGAAVARHRISVAGWSTRIRCLLSHLPASFPHTIALFTRSMICTTVVIEMKQRYIFAPSITRSEVPLFGFRAYKLSSFRLQFCSISSSLFHTLPHSKALIRTQGQKFPLLSTIHVNMPLFSSKSGTSSQIKTSTKANESQSMSDASSTYSSKALLKDEKPKITTSKKDGDKSSMGRAPLGYVSWQSWLNESVMLS
jgi:hypothetical protein